MPVLAPRLPPAERLLPYLRLIDQRRIYSNWGPLVGELEQRLAVTFGLRPGELACASSGTAALIGATLAAAGPARPERPLALIPAFTFVGTAAALERCGYQVHLCDVDAESWILDADAIADHAALDRVGLVVPVAPFGRLVSQSRWSAFRERTGVPVVIDGAASFDRVVAGDGLGSIPVAISFHATKCFATGEGGCVVSDDGELIERAGRALNFGFSAVRESHGASINGRMSEYHAAVGLAELDGWDAKLRALEQVVEAYREVLGSLGLGERLVGTPEIGASYVLFRCRDLEEAESVATALAEAGIGYRRWYGLGLHREPAFSAAPHDELPVTDRLGATVLGVPLAPDLPAQGVERVGRALAAGVSG